MKCDGCGRESAVAYRWASVFVSDIDDGVIMTNAEPELHFCCDCWTIGKAAMMRRDEEVVIGHGFPVD
jgi:hypothetical protein